MKISKYGHARTAIGEIRKDDNKKIGGIIYEHPGSVIDTDKRIIKKSDSIKNLYNFFNPIQEGTAPTKPDEKKFHDHEVYEKRLKNYQIKKANYDRRKLCVKKKIIEDLNKHFSGLVFKKEEKKPPMMRDNPAIISELKRRNIVIEEFSGILTPEDVVSLALRKSLRAHKEGAVCFIRCSGQNEISKEDKEQIESFLNAARKDFGKLDPNSDGNKVVLFERSIDNQNLVVQSDNNDPENPVFCFPIPVESGKNKQHKSEEKKAMNAFLSMYADLHENQRIEYLRKIRRIIDLFFSAPDLYDKKTVYPIPDSVDQTDFNVWAKHEEGKNEEALFVSIPNELKNSSENRSKLDSVKEKELIDELVGRIKDRNKICYRYSVNVTKNSNADCFFADSDINKFWIHHIENAVERLLKYRLRETLFKLDISYLRERVWKDALNFISIKYIAIGKTVFHFGMRDIIDSPKEIQMGLNSFDLEMIKARETLQREMAVYIAFAANNLSRNAVKQINKKNKEDILLWDEKDILDNKKYADSAEELKSVLQFFGGISHWDTKMISDAYANDKYGYDVRFIRDLEKNIFSLRNESFHFMTLKDDAGKWNTGLIGKMFEKEAGDCALFEKKKFYSNNLPMFYGEEELEPVLNALYGHASQKASQIPAFGRIVSRKNLHDFLVEMGIKYPGYDDKTLEKWENACYYLLKEAYYNAFIESNELKYLFKSSLGQLRYSNENEKRAINDFKSRCDDLLDKKKLSVSKLCQNIMTEYNLQNNSKRKVRSSDDSVMEDRIFKHYKLLLEKTLAKAFRDYIRSQGVYAFLGNPSVREMPSEESFLPDWTSNMYSKLITDVANDPDLQKWYITCRFLNGRSLNMLVGSMRSYVQFVGDIRTRAQKTHNWIHKDEKDNAERIRKAISVVEMCIRLADRFSNKVNDYFMDGEDYAKYMGSFIDYGSDSGNGISELNKLRAFCSDPDTPDQIYMDGKNLIVNRNILMAKLYGADSILSEKVSKIGSNTIKEYAIRRTEIGNYIKTGKCRDSKEQEAVLAYQRLKNRIELRDIVEYSEVINELLGQLLNWSFLRERDLLYFQLGFHYMCLNNETVKPEKYIRIDSGNGCFNNVILRQIAGMYINGIGVFCPDENGDITEQSMVGGIGEKIGSFVSYSKSIITDEYGNTPTGPLLYNAGLEVFEVVSEHDAITDTRNAIDHFKYYHKNAGSLLELYSEVFDRFFTYDMKYRKNVPNILRNILLRHNVIIEPAFGTGEKIKEKHSEEKKSCANIRVREISSSRFSYKIPAIGKELEIDARDKEYMETILGILYYPDKKPEKLDPKVRTSKEKDMKKGEDNKKKN